jgi:hypothetical protein
VSYDIEVITHAPPAVEGLGDVTVDGPLAVEPEDLAEALATVVLAPRWLTTLSVPFNASERRRQRVRALARGLAREHQGAAFDPQADAVLWPDGRPKRVTALKAETTSIVRLEWYVPAARWPQAPAALLAGIARRCPEVLPRRYGASEPFQHVYEADGFAAFAAAEDTFWLASRPSFGGHARPPAETVGQVGVDLDWRVLDSDPRWRETAVDLFAATAAAVGAIYAEGWVEPGWRVSSNNRLSIDAGRQTRGSALVAGGAWQGLPAEPAWLTWFGGEYRGPVAAALADAEAPRRRLRRAVVPAVDARPDGLLVRLDELPRAKLPPLPLPAELIRPG